MITAMKKVSVLCMTEQVQPTLDRLADLGLLHVTPTQPPAGEVLDTERDRLARAEDAYQSLAAHSTPPAETDPSRAHGDHVVERVISLTHDRTHLHERLESLRHQRHLLQPYGNFDHQAIATLAAKSIVVKLYHARDVASLQIPEHVQIHILSESKSGSFFAAIGTTNFTLEAQEASLPHVTLEEVDQQTSLIEAQLEENAAALEDLAEHKESVATAIAHLSERVAFMEVQEGMGSSGAVGFLSGFCPAPQLADLQAAAAEQGWGLLIEEPSEDDAVPTLLSLPRWIGLIKPVFKMLGILPGYHEADISAVFLVFFSIFFAILIGDAGYGVLFLLLTLVARAKLPKAPPTPFILFGLLSVCTIAWGVATGNYFGITPDVLPAPMARVRVDWLTGEGSRDHLIRLCFLIGAIHITIAHVWNAIVLFPSLKSIAQAGWICLVWSMYLVALNMVLQVPYPPFFLPLFGVALTLILLFMTSRADMKREWIHHAMFPLSVVNCFVDIVSYIRLFAVGLASLSVAQSFNDMALQLGWEKIWTIPFMALILLLGHGLNIVLCALGILVHGVRLNTLEFSLHKDIQWKGIPFAPFKKGNQD